MFSLVSVCLSTPRARHDTYTAGGMPLAVSQEDFLVILCVSSMELIPETKIVGTVLIVEWMYVVRKCVRNNRAISHLVFPPARCQVNPCLNNGICSLNNGVEECECLRGFQVNIEFTFTESRVLLRCRWGSQLMLESVYTFRRRDRHYQRFIIASVVTISTMIKLDGEGDSNGDGIRRVTCKHAFMVSSH